MGYYLKELRKSLFITIAFVIINRFMGAKPPLWQYVALFLVIAGFVWIIDLFKATFLVGLNDFIRKRFARVAILDGSINSRLKEYPCELVWAGVSPVAWEKAISVFIKWWHGQSVESIPVSEISGKYSLIVNPFGDNYPEEDLKTKKTFYEFCKYVVDGGILVITGGAFYWQQNTRISGDKQQSITKMYIQNGISAQSLKDTLLFQEFGVLTIGGQEPIEREIKDVLLGCNVENKKVKFFRAATVVDSRMDCIPILKQKNDDKIYPVVAVKYGKGFLLHIGLYLTTSDSAEFQIVSEIIDKLVKRKFKF